MSLSLYYLPLRVKKHFKCHRTEFSFFSLLVVISFAHYVFGYAGFHTFVYFLPVSVFLYRVPCS